MDKPRLSDREAALIAAARRDLAVSPAPAAATESGPAVAPQHVPPGPGRPDAAERIAALLRAEQEASLRRKKKRRQFGLVIPAAVLVAALAWVVVAIWRYAKI